MRLRTLLLTFAWVAASVITGGFSQRADASVIVNISQVGSNVVETGAGTFNLTALIFVATGLVGVHSNPGSGDIFVGQPGAFSEDRYFGTFGGPATYGAGGQSDPSTGSGNVFGFNANLQIVVVPEGYVSGNQLSGSSTINNATFISLGITPGSYTWTWGSGATADSLTVNANSATPEPGSWSLFAVGSAILVLTALTRRTPSRSSVR